MILEDLGPTFIKIGQIMSMHSDILPKRYCDELMRLRSDVKPMPFSEVSEVLEESYGCSWGAIFREINEKPLGSASIAQVHKAVFEGRFPGSHQSTAQGDLRHHGQGYPPFSGRLCAFSRR